MLASYDSLEEAFEQGKKSAMSGCNINNSHPYTGELRDAWVDGFKSFKNNTITFNVYKYW